MKFSIELTKHILSCSDLFPIKGRTEISFFFEAFSTTFFFIKTLSKNILTFLLELTLKNFKIICIINIKISYSILRLKMKTPYHSLILSRHNIKFMTSVYRKLTFKGFFTNFGSFIPKSYNTTCCLPYYTGHL